MFRTIYLKQFTYFIYHKQIRFVRAKRGASLHPSRTLNPGIDNRVKILQMESSNYENIEYDDLNFDDLESDFMNAGNMHKEYEREKLAAARKLSINITKSKYFKSPKLPNLLMWSEKEQIQHLNQLDPNEWNAENLSKCFPAPLFVIKKLLKSKWKPKSNLDIERHDKAVQRNWIALKEGKFNLEDSIKYHLLSFTSRKLMFPTEVSDFSKGSKEIILYNQPPGSKEFSAIINGENSKKSLYDDTESRLGRDIQIDVHIPEFYQINVNTKTSDPKSESFVLPGKPSMKQELLSLDEFKEKLIKSISDNADKNELYKKYYDYLSEEKSESNVQAVSSEINLSELEEGSKEGNKLTKYKKKEIVDNLTPQQLDVFMKAENYRLKIRVPMEKKDTMTVYKVKDCFYDTDGKFLYRVPGMK